MSFLGGIFTGSNPTLNGDIGNAGNISGFGTSVGEGDIGAASGFYKDLLSGDQGKEAKLLAPEISTIQKQGQQQNQTAAEFGDRSGGTNASAQNNIDTQRSEVNDMISKLTGGAAAGAASLGTSTLGLGLNANQIQAEESQQKLKNQQDSLLGNMFGEVGGALGDAAVGGLGTIPGLSAVI